MKMQQALDSPKFFPPMFQNHNFAKIFCRQSFVLYGILTFNDLNDFHYSTVLKVMKQGLYN